MSIVRTVAASAASTASAVSAADVEKLRKALAAEHAVLFAYGLLGARTSGSLRGEMSAAYAAHRARRDQLRTLITSRGGKPVEPDASYALPFFPSNATLAVNLAVQLEGGITAAYLELAAASEGALRQYAALAMQEAVRRSYAFRPVQPAAFPGMPAAPPPPTASPTAPAARDGE